MFLTTGLCIYVGIIGLALNVLHSSDLVVQQFDVNKFQEELIQEIERQFDQLPCIEVEYFKDSKDIHRLSFVPSDRSTIRRTRNFGDGSYGLVLGSYGLIQPNQRLILREGNLRIRCYSKLKASHNIDDSRLLSPRYNISFNFYFFSFVLMIHDYGLVVIEIVV